MRRSGGRCPPADVKDDGFQRPCAQAYRRRLKTPVPRSLDEQTVVAKAATGPWHVQQYKAGTITVSYDGVLLLRGKPGSRGSLLSSACR